MNLTYHSIIVIVFNAKDFIHLQRSLQLTQYLDGDSSYGQFGYAITSLNDINDDGFKGRLSVAM